MAKTDFKISASYKKDLLKRAAALKKKNPLLAEGLEDIAYGRTFPIEEVISLLGLKA